MVFSKLFYILTLWTLVSFNWRKCSNQNLGDASIFGVTTSSGQFTTSTGGCAAIGMAKEDQAQVFYAFNHEKVLEDIAKGGGEYYSSLSRLWGCANKLDRSLVQQRYMSLNQLELEDQYRAVKGFSGCSDRLGKN